MTRRTPRLADPVTGLALRLEAQRSFFSENLADLLKDRERNQDINGGGMSEVMPKTGWQYLDFPVLACARTDAGEVVAAAWCAPIRWKDNAGTLSLNIAFATSPDWCGHGLARLLSAMAFEGLLKDKRPPEGALSMSLNIQCAKENLAGQSVALAMGFAPSPSANFDVPAIGRSYVGYTSSAESFSGYARGLIAERLGAGRARQVRERQAA